MNICFRKEDKLEANMKFRHFCFMGYRASTAVAFGVFVLTSGCTSSNIADIEENFDRSDLFTEISSGIGGPSDISGLQGSATYNGAAVASFEYRSPVLPGVANPRPGGIVRFGATADAALTANFETQTIAGSLTAWEDLDPLNFKLDGQIQLSNGTISDNGSFTSQMSGNIQRTAETQIATEDKTPDLLIFTGTAEGQIYNSVQGATASHLKGSFTTPPPDETVLDGPVVSGNFVARQ